MRMLSIYLRARRIRRIRESRLRGESIGRSLKSFADEAEQYLNQMLTALANIQALLDSMFPGKNSDEGEI